MNGLIDIIIANLPLDREIDALQKLGLADKTCYTVQKARPIGIYHTIVSIINQL